MKPEEVPVQFERETIVFAITAWSMGSTLFTSEHSHALGQLFAILVGERMRLEQSGAHPDSGALLIGFHRHLEGQVPEEIRAEFTSLDPERFDATYTALKEQAQHCDAGVDELCHALHEIAAVTKHFAANMQDPEA